MRPNAADQRPATYLVDLKYEAPPEVSFLTGLHGPLQPLVRMRLPAHHGEPWPKESAPRISPYKKLGNAW